MLLLATWLALAFCIVLVVVCVLTGAAPKRTLGYLLICGVLAFGLIEQRRQFIEVRRAMEWSRAEAASMGKPPCRSAHDVRWEYLHDKVPSTLIDQTTPELISVTQQFLVAIGRPASATEYLLADQDIIPLTGGAYCAGDQPMVTVSRLAMERLANNLTVAFERARRP